MNAKTDRELLGLAAKAAGIELYWEPCLTSAGKIYRPHLLIEGTWGHGAWNPLTDDGDALRLAIDLDINIAEAQAGIDWDEADRFALARRAIVRAASAIGESMK